jgi:hypothetical protein
MRRLALTRTLVAVFGVAYVLFRFRYFSDLSRHAASDLAPVGVASVLSAPLPAFVTWTLTFVTVASGVMFLRNVLPRASSAAFFLALLWITTYRSSFGKVLHSENLLVIHVGILAIAAWLRDPERWALRTMAIATTLTYFVAGVSKLRAGGGAWLSGRALGEWIAYDAVRKIELGSFHSPLAAWLAASPVLLLALAIFTLAVEIGAPIALVSPRIARAWAALAWAFHLGVLATMAIGFFYPLSGVAFASLLDVERFPRLSRVLERISGS